MGTVKLNRRTIDGLTVERGNRVFWDSELPGFGIRVHASGHKVYVAQARIPGGLPKRGVIGQYAEITNEEARRKAAEMIDRIRRRLDPVPPLAPPEPTVADLAERYMTAHVEVNCRPGTVEQYRSLLTLHVLPDLGGLRLSEVNRSHASALHYRLRGKPNRANHAVGLLSRMFNLAIAWGMTPARPNPCRSVKRYRERDCERFLNEEEYARLGRVLSEAGSEGGLMASAVAAVRLLLLTGCRRNEILRLRWDDVDRTAGELRIGESKTGPRRVPLTAPVERVLSRIPRIEGNPWVIAGRRRGEPLKDINSYWNRLRERAGLEDLRLHDCRHSYASQALAAGEGLPTIARLLGHPLGEPALRGGEPGLGRAPRRGGRRAGAHGHEPARAADFRRLAPAAPGRTPLHPLGLPGVRHRLPRRRPRPGGRDRARRVPRALEGTLASAGGTARRLEPDALLSLAAELIAPDVAGHRDGETERPPRRWAPRDPLHEQCIAPTGLTFHHPDDEDIAVRVLSAIAFPEVWPGWRGNALIGDFHRDFLQSGCPVLTCLTVVTGDEAAGEKAFLKSARTTQQAGTGIARYLPGLPEKARDWQAVTERIKDGEKLVRACYMAAVYAPLDALDEAEQAVRAIYHGQGWRVNAERYMQLPSWLACLPMVSAGGLDADLERMGRMKTLLTSSAVNLAPLHGEWRGQPHNPDNPPALFLIGRRGQPACWWPFANDAGNYNVAVTGKSGSGKSVLMQELVTGLIGAGGEAVVIDDWRSFQHTAEALGGAFIAFGKDPASVAAQAATGRWSPMPGPPRAAFRRRAFASRNRSRPATNSAPRRPASAR